MIADLSRDRWRSVNGAAGVACLIMDSELPTPVPHGVVEAIIERETLLCAGTPADRLQAGQKVRIPFGPVRRDDRPVRAPRPTQSRAAASRAPWRKGQRSGRSVRDPHRGVTLRRASSARSVRDAIDGDGGRAGRGRGNPVARPSPRRPGRDRASEPTRPGPRGLTPPRRPRRSPINSIRIMFLLRSRPSGPTSRQPHGGTMNAHSRNAQSDPAAPRADRHPRHRGVPARHGGFETFAERFALHLADRGWRVRVACQSDPPGVDVWRGSDARQSRGGHGWSARHRGLRRPLGPAGGDLARSGARARLQHRRVLASASPRRRQGDRQHGRAESGRGPNGRGRCGCGCGRTSGSARVSPIISSPTIPRSQGAEGLSGSARLTMIPYGADRVTDADPRPARAFRAASREYVVVIARAEPENSILEVVTAFCRAPGRSRWRYWGPSGPTIPIIARFGKPPGPGSSFSGRSVSAAVAALRAHALLYVHGHTVGGTESRRSSRRWPPVVRRWRTTILSTDGSAEAACAI